MPIRKKTRTKKRTKKGGEPPVEAAQAKNASSRLEKIANKIVEIITNKLDTECNILPDQVTACKKTLAEDRVIKDIAEQLLPTHLFWAANKLNLLNYQKPKTEVQVVPTPKVATVAEVAPTTAAPVAEVATAPVATAPVAQQRNLAGGSKSLRRKSLVHKKQRCPKYSRRKSVRCKSYRPVRKSRKHR